MKRIISLLYGLCLVLVCASDFQQPLSQDLIYAPEAIQRYTHTDPGSYFGYSVAGYVGQSQTFCLVGAPRAKNDPSGGFDSPTAEQSVRTGAVYRIELDPELPYCSVVPVATTDEARREHGTPTPGISSWLGGSVAAASNSLNGIQLACDPRYIHAPDPINRTDDLSGLQTRTFVGTGQCALYTGASMRYTSVDSCISQVEGACLSGFSADVGAGKQFGEAFVVLGMPGSYLSEGNVFLGHYRGREVLSASRLKNSPQDLKHMGFNLGFSVQLAKLVKNRSMDQPDAPKSQEHSLLFGSRDKWSVLVSSSMWIDNDYRGIVMILDQALDQGGITYLKDQWSHIGSFFGYSLATADLDGNGILDIIVGAPYYTENKGQSDSLGHIRVRAATNAPQSRDTEPPDQSWGRLLPDIGKVYIFYGYHDFNQFQSHPDYLTRDPVVLSGFKTPSGRFGHALVNLGDVDGDGTDDLAVSCPYCSDPQQRKDKGAVLIYLGKRDKQLEDKPFQVIWPSDFPRSDPVTTCGDFLADGTGTVKPFLSFGWSLSGGTDLDGNHAPDLLVGDFDSDQLVLLRSRNTLWFDSPQWDIPHNRALPWSGPNRSPCGPDCQFTIHLSVAVHGNHWETGKQFKAHVQIDLDAEMEGFVLKRLAGTNNLHTLDGGTAVLGVLDTTVPIESSDRNKGKRMSLVSLVLEPLVHRVSPFLWKPIRINVSITPVTEQTAPWTLHPFLGHRSFLSRPMHFVNPACGPDHICRADLQVRMVDLSEGPVDNRIVYFRERITQRNLTVGIGNTGENAYAAQLRLTIPNQFSFTVPDGLACRPEINHEKHATLLLCELGDPLGYTGSNFHPYVFQLNTAGAFRNLDQVPMNDQPASVGEWNTTIEEAETVRTKRAAPSRDTVEIVAEVISGNSDSDPRDNIARIKYNLQLSAKIGLSSSSIDRTIMDTRNFSVQLYEMQRVHPETLGPEIKHVYLVSNDGPSPVANLWVNISMPVQTQHGEYLVYFLDRVRYRSEMGGPPLLANMAPEVVSAEGHIRGTCYIPQWALNPMRLNAVHRGQPDERAFKSESEWKSSRTKRAVDFGPDAMHPSGNKSQLRNTRSLLTTGRKRQQKIIKCGEDSDEFGEPICVTIKCRIDQLSRTDAVRIVIRGHVWADTFFRHKISDLAIVSEAKAELPETVFNIPVHGNRTVEPLTISQNFVFSGIKIPLFREIPLWPIILGCILGAVLLAFIIFGMWRCGFFRRKRWYDHPPPNSIAIAPSEF